MLHLIVSKLLFPARSFFFFFNDTATTEIYTLSLHDALPICLEMVLLSANSWSPPKIAHFLGYDPQTVRKRSEEHTSELQSPCNLVCRLLLEKKKITTDLPHNLLRSATTYQVPQSSVHLFRTS